MYNTTRKKVAFALFQKLIFLAGLFFGRPRFFYKNRTTRNQQNARACVYVYI